MNAVCTVDVDLSVISLDPFSEVSMRFPFTCNIVDRHRNFRMNVRFVRIFDTFIVISKKLK